MISFSLRKEISQKEKQNKLQTTLLGAALGAIRSGESRPQAAAEVRPLYVTSRVGGPDPRRPPPFLAPAPAQARPLVPAHVAGAGSKSNGALGRRLPQRGGSNELDRHSRAASTLLPIPPKRARGHLRSQSQSERAGGGTGKRDKPPSVREGGTYRPRLARTRKGRRLSGRWGCGQ